MPNKKRLAIIGAGISGLSTAFHLHNDYDITVYEKESYFGGHTDTHDLIIDGKSVRVDSGFIIFCPEFYPNFFNMLKRLGVKYKATNMSFSAHNRTSGLVYNATNPNKLFCQRRNLFNPRFYRMIFDILRFYHTARRVLQSSDTSTTVAQYLQKKRYGKGFIEDHLFPMISALWSATPERVAQFPIRHLVDFFSRHGLMQIFNRPTWQVIEQGSNNYIKALRQQLKVNWKSDSEVVSVLRDNVVEIQTRDGSSATFDAVVFALHADEALSIIDKPSPHEVSVLGDIPFETNHVVVHTDDSIMHRNRQSWASWNTEVPSDFDPKTQRVCTANYWMNSLQGLDLNTNVFTSLNSTHKIDPSKVLAKRTYSHPVFTAQSVAAQKNKSMLDGRKLSYFVGAYWGWGFHEDGARSAVDVCKQIRSQLK